MSLSIVETGESIASDAAVITDSRTESPLNAVDAILADE
jgi:hypothetical protein